MRPARYIPAMTIRSLWFPVAALTALVGCDRHTTDKDLRIVRLAEVRAALTRNESKPGHALLLDARPPARFDESHIPGARRMTLPPLDAGGGDPALKGYSLLIVYGQNPADYISRALGKRLIQLGYRGVRLFAGGYEEWARAGNPVEPTAPAAPTP